MAANANLHKAKNEKNDEFYTQLTDVANELKHYRQHFAGKTVFCNCDDPTWSAFWKYFHLNFSVLGLKKLVSTHYDRNEPTYKMEYEGGDDNNIEAGVKTPLEGNGDFRNQECLDLLDECDIVVTNPPFSIALEFYVPLLVKHKKQFLIIGDLNWIPKAYVFPLIVKNQMWLGYNNVKEFLQPDGNIAKFGNKLWFTNLDHKKRHERLVLWKNYTPEGYPTYINYDAININEVGDIPVDYDGLMSVPITFLSTYNPEQFEIVGCPNYKGEYGRDAIGVRRLGEEWLARYRAQGGTGHYTANMAVPVYFDKDGVAKRPFSKIIIRRKVGV